MKNITIVTLAIALIPGWAVAQNGVVQINQSTIAGSGQNRNSGGFPYVITQSGSYQLTSNLTAPPNASAIVISASFVTLDLNGFAISCTGGCTGSGVTDNGIQQYGIAIRNGTVFGFENGLLLTASTGSVIEKVTAQSNGNTGIWVFNSSTVKDCTALFNGSFGIFASVHVIVSGSVATGNGGYGISIGTGTLTGNTADGNAGGGIDVGLGNSTLTGNTASNDGVGFNVGAGSTLTGNTASADFNGFLITCPGNLIGNTAVGDTLPAALSAGCNEVNNLGF